MVHTSAFDLAELVARIFDQAQLSLASHRKNCVALYKIHCQSAAATGRERSRATTDLAGEKAFCDVFLDMVGRVLVVRNSAAPAERVVRFIGSYVKFLVEKEQVKLSREESSAGADNETPATRFVTRLLEWLLQGFIAKDKTVRLRCVGLVLELISHLGELDEETYVSLKEEFMERSSDKEATIRALAVIGMSKLLGGEDPAELPDGEPSIFEALLDVLCYDTSAEVRRAALLHVPLIHQTLPAILSRSRDVDPMVRKLLFSSILSPSTGPKTSRRLEPALAHPRQLTLAQREQVIRDGLGDREDAVRLAAAKMVGGWFDATKETAGGASVLDELAGFMKLFDVVGPEGNGVAVDALESLFVVRPTILAHIRFPDNFWSVLNPESAITARVFLSYCLDNKRENILQRANLPLVTALAFHLQEACNGLLDCIEDLEEARLESDLHGEVEDETMDRMEDAVLERSFVVREMLRLVARCDFSDEIGRRKVFGVIREMLGHELLPESLFEPGLGVLKETTTGERELIRVVVEIVHVLRDGADEDELLHDESRANGTVSSDITQHNSITTRSRKQSRPPWAEMSPGERAKVDSTDLRCLALCIAMLSRVNGTFDENSTLDGILADLIIPAVKRNELALRERGLVSLGLCCLIAKNMAMSSFQLFLNQVQTAPEGLKVKVLHIIFDMLMVYENELLGRSKDMTERIVSFLLQTLEVEESPAVQAALCIGMSKLMLRGLIEDEHVLTSLVLAYVSPVTAQNQELRQCLAFSLPAYCHSSAANQLRMQSIALVAHDLVVRVYDELAEDEDMVSPSQFGQVLVDWTDPRKIANFESASTDAKDTHVRLAIDIVKALHDPQRRGEDKKELAQLLSKLYFPDDPDPLLLVMLDTALMNLEDVDIMRGPAAEKILLRFRSRFEKLFSNQLQSMDRRKHERDPQFHEMCRALKIELEDEDEDRDEDEQRKRSRESADGAVASPVATLATNSFAAKRTRSSERPTNNTSSANSRAHHRGAAKKRRLAVSATSGSQTCDSSL